MKTIEGTEILYSDEEFDEEEIKSELEMVCEYQPTEIIVQTTVEMIKHVRRQSKRKMEKIYKTKMEKIEKQHSIEKIQWKERKNKLEKGVKKLQELVKKVNSHNIRMFKDLGEEMASNIHLYNESVELCQKITELKTEIGKTSECPVCLEKFHRKRQLPRILPCGHPICFGCWSTIFDEAKYKSKCPKCGKPFFPDLFF